ncbi:MAG: tetratricopeptide repeat protein [bacterium]|nr:tetratricopeptide repeat protein [bacterium]
MATALLALVIISLSPAHAGPFERGEYYAGHGEFSHALAAYKAAVEQSDRDTRALANFKIARIYVAMENWLAAASHFAKVVADKPKWSKAQSGLAWSLYSLGHYKAALEHARSATKLAPEDYFALDTFGRIHIALDNVPEAARALRAAWRADPRHEKGVMDLIRIGGFPPNSHLDRA